MHEPLRQMLVERGVHNPEPMLAQSLLSNARLKSMIIALDRARYAKGETAEIGCHAGGTSYYIGMLNGGRRHWAVDTFEGLKDTGEADPDLWNGQFSAASLTFESVRDRLAPVPNIRVMKGFFPDCAPEMDGITYSFVHIDVDSYASMRCCIDYFIPRMSNGGIIAMDDVIGRGTVGGKRAWAETDKTNLHVLIEIPAGDCHGATAMRSIRCGRGLGDSIYLQSVARHIIERDGKPLEICSDWPEVFAPLGDKCRVVPFRRTNVRILAHYASRKKFAHTTQFRDCCINAGFGDDEHAELSLGWPRAASYPAIALREQPKPVLVVALPRAPMGRTDGFGMSILPTRRAMQRIIDAARGRYLVVMVGAGTPLYKLDGIDVDLSNKTTVTELLDICSVADRILGYCSFVLAAADALKIRAMMVWARAGLDDPDEYIRQITPSKIIEDKTLISHIIDDATDGELEHAAQSFL